MARNRELGSLQQKVLYFLAENPNRHKQAIQRGIGYRSEQYGSVLNATNSLEKRGYIKSIQDRSEKNIKIKIYSCTEKGITYTLTKNPNADIPGILDNYKEEYQSFMHFRTQYDIWGRDLFLRFYKYLWELQPLIAKIGFDNALPYLYPLIFEDIQNYTSEDEEKINDVLLKIPGYKKQLKMYARGARPVTKLLEEE